eukprot:11329782-Heterocapsa_arctica.AAC.1
MAAASNMNTRRPCTQARSARARDLNKTVRVYTLASNSQAHSEPRPRLHPSLPLSVMATSARMGYSVRI